jgi:predicted anti-sigma-YlaC factor YlaD
MRILPVLMALGLPLATGCSLKRLAVDRLGTALAEGGATFAEEEDLELVRDASPFGLKTLESLLAQSPRHRGLLQAACAGFTQYAYAFVQQEADFIEAQNLPRATAQRLRAKKLYLRARGYGLRAFDEAIPGFSRRIRTEPEAVLAQATKAQVPLLYHTAAAWAAAFALDVTDAGLAVDQTLIEKMMHRALDLDEGWRDGSLHGFFISWEAGHASAGGSISGARAHFAQAQRHARGRNAAAYVALAEAVSLQAQDRAEFERLLQSCLALDPDKEPAQRLAILVAQRRAAWLLSRADDLFLEPAEPRKEGLP